ncbi:MAG: site-specific integrase [Desulfobacteraceae bacterium]|nr:MAG: site-specific integrase [Desulfobacteraceae bacterium]
MSSYFVKGKGWRYDFTLKGTRHTGSWFKKKTEARTAEEARREELVRPRQETEIPTDISFLELVNRRLDHVKVYCSESHYRDCRYMAKRWVKRWGKMLCGDVTQDMIEKFVIWRSSISPDTANKEVRYIRATFNYGLKKGYVKSNPCKGIEFLPVVKKPKKPAPEPEMIDKVISLAEPDVQDYLWTIRETMGRVSEINRLCWEDMSFDERSVTLYTRKKKGGHLTPRKVPMTEKLFEVLSKRYTKRDTSKPWVFWHRYWSKTAGDFKEGPFRDRKKFMKSLCRKAGVLYFRFHALRHSGASVMDNNNVPIGAIQRILGHENRTTTEIYLHSISDEERRAIDAFERASRNPHTVSHTPKKRELCDLVTSA